MEYVLHYDTSSSIGIITRILVCVPEAQGTATYYEFSRVNAVTHLRMPDSGAARICLKGGQTTFSNYR